MPSSSDPKWTACLFFLALATPVIIAIWFVPWFVTQDGPRHVYNAHILSALSNDQSAFKDFYSARAGLLPYVGVYKLLGGLMSIVSPRTADRLLMTLTSTGFAASVLWLRWRVVGWDKMWAVVPLVLLVSISRLWLLGLYFFLLGACLFAVTLGFWWRWREDLNPARAGLIAVLLAANYFFHVVSAGITAFALAGLAAATPGSNLRKRVLWTAASIAPSAALIVGFGSLMENSGGALTEWTGLADAFSIQSWIQYLQTADFISFSFKEPVGALALPTDCPFVEQNALRYAVLWPSIWAGAGLLLLLASTLRSRATLKRLISSEYRGWIVITALLFCAGLFGPSAGGQGTIVRERLLLLGVVTLVPLIRPGPETAAARVGLLLLAVAAALQIAFVLDYARISNRVAGKVMQVTPYLEGGQRVALMIADPRTHYLLNPLPDIANQLGVSKDVVVWNNYGPSYYYFPVDFRSGQVRDQWKRVDSLNQLLVSGGVEAAAKEHTTEWSAAVGEALDTTDVLIVWGVAPWFDSLCEKWFQPEPFFEQGELRAFKHR
jgi:hypothetical protein